jgi:predicted metal-binding membrane protein
MITHLEAGVWRTIPRLDRLGILSTLVGGTTLAWIYLFRLADEMTGSSIPMAAIQVRPWEAADFILIFLMWAIMMVGMMVPSAAPTVMIYAAVARKAARDGTLVPPTAVFISGYIALWTVFCVVATLAQWGLDQAALLSPMMVTTSPAIGSGLLIGAGLYQVTPIKRACLKHCRSPAHFLAEHWRAGITGAFRMGLEHGVFCLGCCWVLMGLLFVGGVMNLLWIAAIATFVFAEKVIPLPDSPMPARLTGGAMILGGLVLLGTWAVGGG